MSKHKSLRIVPGLTDSDLQLFVEHIDLDMQLSVLIEKAIPPVSGFAAKPSVFMARHRVEFKRTSCANEWIAT